MTLYRKEAVEGQSNRIDGEILLVQSWSSWMIFWIVALLIVITVTYLFLSTYTKRTTATGQLVPNGGAISIGAPISGTVASVHVVEGQKISAGDLLFTIKDQRYLSNVSNAPDQIKDQRYADNLHIALESEEHALLQAREQTLTLADQTTTALKRQLVSLDAEINQAEEQIARHSQRITLAKRSLDDRSALVKAGFYTKHALTEQEDNLAALETQESTYKRELKSLRSRRIEVENELNSVPTKTNMNLSTIDGQLSVLHQKIQEQEIQGEVNIVAPIDGVITGINAHVGQITTSQPLAVLLSENSKLQAYLYLSSREVGFVEAGQNVRIRYQAYPYQKFGQYSGTVAEVSQSPVARETLPPNLAIASGTEYYRAIVNLKSQFANVYEKQKHLVSGMVVEADIEQENRKLIEWIFEPLYGLKKYN